VNMGTHCGDNDWEMGQIVRSCHGHYFILCYLFGVCDLQGSPLAPLRTSGIHETC